MYEYKALVEKVYDGDTITVNIDLGFGFEWKKVKIRLYGIDAPEMHKGTVETMLAGEHSRDMLAELILGQQVIIRTHKDKQGKYGRWLGDIWLTDGTNRNVNQWMVDNSYAKKAFLQ